MANSNSPAFLTIVGQEALKILRNNIVLASAVNTNFKNITEVKGKTLQIPTGGQFVVNDKALNGEVMVQDSSISMIDVVLDKHKEVSFIIDDIEKSYSEVDFFDSNQKSAIEALAVQVETDLFTLVDGLSQAVGTAGLDITDALCREIDKTLNDAKVPRADRYMAVSSKDYSALLGIDRFTEVQKYGANQAISTGEVGTIYGMKVKMSQLVPVVAGAPDTTKNLAFHKDAFALAVRPLPVEVNATGIKQQIVTDPVSGLALRVTMSYDASKLGWVTTFDLLYGISAVRDTSGVRALS